MEAAPNALLPSERADGSEKYFQRGGHNFCTLRRNFLENNTPFIFKNNGKKKKITSKNLQKSNQGEFCERKCWTTFSRWVGTESPPERDLHQSVPDRTLWHCDRTAAHPDAAPWEQNHFSSKRVQLQRMGPQRPWGLRLEPRSLQCDLHSQSLQSCSHSQASLMPPSGPPYPGMHMHTHTHTHTCPNTLRAQVEQEGNADARQALYPWHLGPFPGGLQGENKD